MSWFTKGKRHPGWLALQVHEDQVDLVHVHTRVDGKPSVALCDSFRKEQSDASTLTRLRGELKLHRYHCTTLLSGEHYQIHEVEAPNVPAAETKAAVRWRVKDIIDFPVELAVIDVLEIPADPEAPGRNPTLYAVTARKDGVEACTRPFESAHIALNAVDIPELAQRNIATLFETEDSGGIAMLSFYAEEGLLTFTRAGELYASRRIEIPLAQLLDANYKQRAEHLERIALEVQRSLDHFERQFHYVPLAKLLLGPLPRDIGLQEYLASSIDGVVESADLASVMELSAAPHLGTEEGQSQYLALLGAALRGEGAVA
jgi:MSHA biogenesis protein MshI